MSMRNELFNSRTFAAVLIFVPLAALAQAGPDGQMGQGMGDMGAGCSMMRGGMGGWMMFLGVLLILSLIAALIALAVFLVRRSRPEPKLPR